jgi:hypothetical protein
MLSSRSAELFLHRFASLLTTCGGYNLSTPAIDLTKAEQRLVGDGKWCTIPEARAPKQHKDDLDFTASVASSHVFQEIQAYFEEARPRASRDQTGGRSDVFLRMGSGSMSALDDFLWRDSARLFKYQLRQW